MTKIVVFTKTFLTFPSPSIEQYVLAKFPTKSLIYFKLYQFCDIKTKQRDILQEDFNISNRELSSLVDSLRDFPESYWKSGQVFTNFITKTKIEIRSTKSRDNLIASYYNEINERSRRVRLSFRFGKKISCAPFHQKVWTTRHSIYSNKNCQLKPSLREPILRCSQFRKIWNQLRCVAHSPLIVGMTIALIFSFGTRFVWTQNVRVNLPAQKTFQSLSGIDNQCPQVVFVCEGRNIPFEDPTISSSFLAKWFIFLKRVQNQFKMLLEMSIVMPSIVSTERIARISWRLCENSEINLWFWRVRSLVVCSQSSFNVTGARKDDKNRKKTLSLFFKKR